MTKERPFGHLPSLVSILADSTVQPDNMYPQGDRSGVRKPKRISINTNHNYHQHSTP